MGRREATCSVAKHHAQLASLKTAFDLTSGFHQAVVAAAFGFGCQAGEPLHSCVNSNCTISR